MTVLEELAERPMRAKDLTDTLGIKWTTAYRTIAYLHDNGFLERDGESGRYYIAARLYYIGRSYLNHLPILQGTDAHLGSAAQETGATVQLVQRYRRRSIVLAIAEPNSGAHIPKTTIGWHFRCIVARRGRSSSPTRRQPSSSNIWTMTTTSSRPTRSPIRRSSESVWRKSTRAASRSPMRDVQLSTGAVAAPIADAAGQVVASLTLIVRYSELGKLEGRLVEAAAQTAQLISISLGWRPDAGVKAAEDGAEPAGRFGEATLRLAQ